VSVQSTEVISYFRVNRASRVLASLLFAAVVSQHCHSRLVTIVTDDSSYSGKAIYKVEGLPKSVADCLFLTEEHRGKRYYYFYPDTFLTPDIGLLSDQIVFFSRLPCTSSRGE